MSGEEYLGVAVFYSHKTQLQDEDLLNMMDAIGKQVGQYVKQKEAEVQLHKMSLAIEQSSSSIIITDVNGNIEYVNPHFTRQTGYTTKEVVGKTPRILKSGEIPSEGYKNLWDTILSGKEWRGEFHNKKKDDTFFWEHASISPVKNPQGIITHFLAIKEDITERKKHENQLLFMANHGPLTNLFNRRRFREELKLMVAQSQRYKANGALLFLDLDNFKYVNDTLGHQKGDALLINVSILLRDRMRETDILARLGGDEFAVILPHTNEDQALSISRQILKIVHKNIFIDKNVLPVNISASIGVVLFPEHGDDAEKLLTYADLAMYKTKEEGRNRICVYSTDHKMQVESQLIWENRVRKAIKDNQFVLFLQPILGIKNGSIKSYEALIRMISDSGEIILPEKFIHIAERFGLINEIDHWVVCRAIHLIAEQEFDKRGIVLEVNLSAKALTNRELLSVIIKGTWRGLRSRVPYRQTMQYNLTLL